MKNTLAITAAAAILGMGYLLLNVVIPKAIFYGVESGALKAPANYEIYRAKLEAI